MNAREKNENRIRELEAEVEWRNKEIERLRQPQWYDSASTGGGCTADILVLDSNRKIEVIATEVYGGQAPDPSENVVVAITLEDEPRIVFEITYEAYQTLRQSIYFIH
jgi:hypothetical protein